MAPRLRVAIIGGGTGGLCLAQALHHAGVTVKVYERGPARAQRVQGYRIRINAHGSAALHECLPSAQWQAFVDACGIWHGSFGFVDHRLRQLMLIDNDTTADPEPSRAQHSISRAALHQVLSAGLADADVLHHDKEFTHYHRNEDDTVTCEFVDGSTVTADMVIGADGANSQVRKQFLPHADRVDTGIVTVAGKFPLTEETKRSLPASIQTGQQTVIPPRGCGMFIAPHELTNHDQANGAADAVRADVSWDGSYVLWAYAARGARYPSQVDRSTLDGAGLRTMIGHLIADWHPLLRRLVAESPAESVSLLPILTSVPVSPWPTSNITLLGDAIHSMTPFRGIGANTALRDARLLSRNLLAAARGEQELRAAVESYETEMRVYGFAAVRDSLRTGTQLVSDNRVARTGFKAALRVFSAIPPLKRKVFGSF